MTWSAHTGRIRGLGQDRNHDGRGTPINRTTGLAGVVANELGWFFLWPALVLTRFVIQPMVADRSRRCEFEADAAAKRAGYGASLTEALIYLGGF
ncbi:MAG: hypothetical protein ACHQ4F_16285 [Candidatus Dormibacteria bacterium]